MAKNDVISVEVPRQLRDDVLALMSVQGSWESLTQEGRFARVAHTINLPQRAATLLCLTDEPQSCNDLKYALEDLAGMPIEAAHARFYEYGKNMFVPSGFARAVVDERGISRFAITPAGRDVAVPMVISAFQYMQESGLGLPRLLGPGGSVGDRDGPYRVASFLAELSQGQVERCVLQERLGLNVDEVARKLEHVVLDVVPKEAHCRFRLNAGYSGEVPQIPYRQPLASKVLAALEGGKELMTVDIMSAVGLASGDNRGNISSVLTWYKNQGVVERVEPKDVSYVLHDPFGLSLGRFLHGMRDALGDERKLAAIRGVTGAVREDHVRMQRLVKYALTRHEKDADEA